MTFCSSLGCEELAVLSVSADVGVASGSTALEDAAAGTGDSSPAKSNLGGAALALIGGELAKPPVEPASQTNRWRLSIGCDWKELSAVTATW